MTRRAKLLTFLAVFAVAGLGIAWGMSIPHPLTAADIPAHTPDIANGKELFNAAGCLSCHKAGPDLKNVDAALPAGGAVTGHFSAA